MWILLALLPGHGRAGGKKRPRVVPARGTWARLQDLPGQTGSLQELFVHVVAG